MNVRWRQHYVGQNWSATVDGKIVAEVVPYGRPGSQYWAAWVGHDRIDNCATDTEAKAAVERFLARSPTEQMGWADELRGGRRVDPPLPSAPPAASALRAVSEP
jgi:hypothetical protein